MFDLTNIQAKGNVQTFTSAGTWQTWVKPARAKMVDILCIGGGAGGSGGGAANATVNGGNGGGSSAFTKATFNAQVIPDILYIYTGLGGRGGIGATVSPVVAADNTLTSGSISYVTVTPDTGSTAGIVCRSGNLPPVVNTAGSVATIAQMILLNLAANFNTVAGQAGVTAISTQANLTPITIVTAGAAGSNAASTGTSAGCFTGINAVGPIPGLLSIPQTAYGQRGGNGYTVYDSILAFVGGGGGRGITGSLVGGPGGNGSYGCGGGGGGASYGPTAIGGRGGNGGDGIVIITTSF